MLKIKAHIVDALRSASDLETLRHYLQGAIELEHSTIPPYLTALYSVKPGHNQAAAEVIGSVVVQEMLHLTIACNVLNAIGGAPTLDKPGFIPVYPGPLPMNVDSGLTVGLKKLTRGLVQSVFMSIEEPEKPNDYISLKAYAAAPPAKSYATIGDFYNAIIEQIERLGEPIFTGDSKRQVMDPAGFPPDQLFPIHNVETAVRGLKIIIDQGEGTAGEPTEPDSAELAHYYRFSEIVRGRKLVKDASAPKGYSYSGAPVGIDPAGIYDLYPDPKAGDYAPGSQVRMRSDVFNGIYTNLLRRLHETFNGSPTGLAAAVGLMFELKLAATQLVSLTIPGTTLNATPTFEYHPG